MAPREVVAAEVGRLFGGAIGLHFGGSYLSDNGAIPLWRLAGEELLPTAKVNFA
jgi:hypothetical protein